MDGANQNSLVNFWSTSQLQTAIVVKTLEQSLVLQLQLHLYDAPRAAAPKRDAV